MDARHVQRVVGVRHEIPEPRGPRQPVGEGSLNGAGAGQTPEGIRVSLWGPEVELQARGHGQINRDLDGMPQAEDHGVGRVGARLEIVNPLTV